MILWHFTQALRVALADDAIGGIVIDVDSPGGSVYGVMELADEIYRSRARKPIFAIANGLAASGAYWIASAASELYVTPGARSAASACMIHVDLSKGLQKAGIETTLIAVGKFKSEGNPFQPRGADARAAMQKRVDTYYRAFVANVAKHRNVPESAARNGMGHGRLLDAERANRQKMVDGVAAFDEAIDILIQRICHGSARALSLRGVRPRAQCHIVETPHSPSMGTASRPAKRSAVRQREIELLSL
nr:S49 family peptidase [Burkholderia pseudomallei]